MRTQRGTPGGAALLDEAAATGESATKLHRRLARTAGVLYLLVGILGGFAVGVVYPEIYAAGDAVTTARNAASSAGLIRAATVADLLQAVIWVFLALALYRLLKGVSQGAASAMVVLTAIGAGITCLNAVFAFEGLRVATDAQYATVLGAAGSSALTLLLRDIHHYRLFGIEQIFFGLWLVPLGYLVYRSGFFPQAPGVVLIVARVCYLLDVLGLFLVPALREMFHAFIVAPVASIAEIWMLGYLLIKGVRSTPGRALA